MDVAPVLIAGRWRPAGTVGSFQAENPALGEPFGAQFPVSGWADCDAALAAAAQAARELAALPAERLAVFLDDFAARIEATRDAIVGMAHQESALPTKPRLYDVELPRTTGQLRQAASAAREGTWALPTIDSKAKYPLDVAADRASRRFRTQQLSVGVQ